jgi:hypothetical protein
MAVRRLKRAGSVSREESTMLAIISPTLAALQAALASHVAYEKAELKRPTPLAEQGLVGSRSEAVRIEVEAAYAMTTTSDAERVGMVDLALAYEGTNLDDAMVVALQSIRRGSLPN